MKKAIGLAAAIIFVGLATIAPASGGDDASQSAKATVASFELKMRILEGVREKASGQPKSVTSSYLTFTNFANYELEEDVKAGQQIMKVYNLEDVGLLTEATLAWDRSGKAEKAFHMFRINGHEYAVFVTPGTVAGRNQFRIEVFEQEAAKKSSLLDTEFSLPDKSEAVFGFENTQMKPYFITLRVAKWLGEPAGAGAAGGVVGGAQNRAGGEKVKPPKLVREVRPVYPKEAAKAGVAGVVIMEATTDTFGRIADVKVLRSIPLLDQAAVDALKQWVYEPMIVDGKPRPVVFTVTMRFNLDDKKKPQVEGAVGGVQGGVTGGVEGGVIAGAKEDKQFEGDAVRAVGKIEPPKAVKTVNPVYPEKARQARVEGIVVIEAKTDEAGNVVDARVLRSIPVLDQAAIDAVKQWKYEPLVIDGKAHKVVFTVTVRFMFKESDRSKTVEKFTQGAVKAEGDVKPPKLVREVAPVYPEAARVAGVQGVVILSVRTDEAGRVTDTMVLRSIPLLDQAAIDAVRQWVYEPFLQDGKAVPIVFTVTVRFLLQ